MPMNFMHRKLCSSQKWADGVAEKLPGSLHGIDLGDNVLEIGPGFGATTRVLQGLVPKLTAVEVDKASVGLLRKEFDGQVDVVHGDGAELPFEDGRFSAVVCFTMLHHVPSLSKQDSLFAEACRVLRGGGVFRGVDSQPNFRFRLLHIGDTMNTLDPQTLPDRLGTAGFAGVEQQLNPGVRIMFLGKKPA